MEKIYSAEKMAGALGLAATAVAAVAAGYYFYRSCYGNLFGVDV